MKTLKLRKIERPGSDMQAFWLIADGLKAGRVWRGISAHGFIWYGELFELERHPRTGDAYHVSLDPSKTRKRVVERAEARFALGVIVR